MTVETFCNLVRAVEPAAQLVEARILRRVIRMDRRLPGFGLSVLRRKSYTIERERLLTFVDRNELELPPAADLPRMVILLAKPSDDELQDPRGVQRVRERYARLLYHECVHAELARHHTTDGASLIPWANLRREELGEIEFAEIRAVLLKDEQLFPAPTDAETYSEFLATYLELRYFAPQELPLYFPAIRDWEAVERIVSHDLDHARLYERLQFPETPALMSQLAEESAELEQASATTSAPRISLAEFRRWQAKAERAAAVGNSVSAAITHTRAANRGPSEYAAEAHAAARSELWRIALRMQAVLDLSTTQVEQWATALEPLLAPASAGFWASEARLLYDLQKVCVEQERGVYRMDLVEWIRTWGRRPIRRPLPLLRDALMIRHLRTAQRRIASARMGGAARQRLTDLVTGVLELIEQRSRDRLRPAVVDVFTEVGLVPVNIPERVAQRKLVEELIDRVVEHSYVSLADVRDALSKNDLKLPDVGTVADLAQGDRLLRADKKLDTALDGVYRRGAIYQRWPQSISSLAFGTNFGRIITKYLALPYGGAYLAIEFIRHVAMWLTGQSHDAHDLLEHGALPAAEHPGQPWGLYSGVFVMGTWISLLIHVAEFRAWNIAALKAAWRWMRKLLIDLPSYVIHSKIVQQILHSQVFAAIHNYINRPALVTALIYGAAYVVGYRWSQRLLIDLFLVVNLILNSPIGRYAVELTADFLVRVFHELRMRVFAAAIQWIMAVFQRLLVALERLVYMVDEWLLFRAGDGQTLKSVKLIGGVAWFFVAYVVVFVFTLLIEPQINPIKHFPVVTVSHKLILPAGPLFVKQLTPYIGYAQANTLVWTTIWLIPGVFGYLVWELKENWRLYAANRAAKLRPTLIGQHGETMTRLLRPGFHSGTLPKAFAALRRAARKLDRRDDTNPLNSKLAAIHHVEVAVQRFVEREFLFLLQEADMTSDLLITVAKVHAATNRIDVTFVHADHPEQPLVVTWEDEAGELSATITELGWLKQYDGVQLARWRTALAGLFQRSGVERVDDECAPKVSLPITWQDWVEYWTPVRSAHIHPPTAHTPSDSVTTV